MLGEKKKKNNFMNFFGMCQNTFSKKIINLKEECRILLENYGI